MGTTSTSAFLGCGIKTKAIYYCERCLGVFNSIGRSWATDDPSTGHLGSGAYDEIWDMMGMKKGERILNSYDVKPTFYLNGG